MHASAFEIQRLLTQKKLSKSDVVNLMTQLRIFVKIEAVVGEKDSKPPEAEEPQSARRSERSRTLHRSAVCISHPVEDDVDQRVVPSQGFADQNLDVRVIFRRAPHLRRDILGGMSARTQKVGMYDDSGRPSCHAGVDALGDVGFREFEVCNCDDTLGNSRSNLLGDFFQPSVRLLETASMVDEQDRALHCAFALRSSACARSSQRSSACSIPTDSRTVASVIPLLRFSSGGKAP